MLKKLLKVKSKSTYIAKDGKEKHYYNYYLEVENGKRIQIKPSFEKDLPLLDLMAEYVG